MKKLKKINKSILLLIIIIITVIANVIYVIHLFRIDSFTKEINKNEPITILFIVSDEKELNFLNLFLYNPETKKAGFFYIPPNLCSKIKLLNRFDKIAVIYEPDNLKLIQEKTGQLMSIPISFYIDMSLEDVSKLVDLVGGLEFFISNPVESRYEDKNILFPSGSVVLDGDKVELYITYELDMEEEAEIIGRKHDFLKALLKKIGNPDTNKYILKQEPLRYLRKHLNTNLNKQALKAFLVEITKMDSEQIVFQRALGNKKIVEGINGEVLFPYYEGELMKETIKQTLETISSKELIFDDSMVVKIEILNGTNIEGMARRTKVLFESFGLNVVSIKNADNDEYLTTLILDRKSKPNAASKVAKLIKCEKIYHKLEPAINVDVTVIIGRDFNGRYCKK